MKSLFLTVAAAALMIFAGCSTIPQKQPQKLPVIENSKAQAAAKTFFEQFTNAVKNSDSDFIDKKILVQTIAENIGRNAFAQYCSDMKKHLGNITGTEYVSSLRNPLYHSFIWKLTCMRESANKENKQPVITEVLFHVQVVPIDNQYKVLNFVVTR